MWPVIPISLRISHSLLWATQRFCSVNVAEVDVFLEFPCCLYDPTNVDNLISGSSAFSKPSLYSGSSQFTYWTEWSVAHFMLKCSLGDFECNLTCMRNECSCPIVWIFFGIALFWDWNENWHFPILWPLLSFPDFLTYWVQHFNSIIF